MNSKFRTTLFLCCALPAKSALGFMPVESCPESLYDTELEAVRAAANHYNPQSIREDREFMGAIIELRGKYSYTVSSAGAGEDKWRLSIPAVDWERVRAFWHTHGDHRAANRYFSESDTRSAVRFGLPFYLADYTGYLKIFRSGDKTLSPFAAERLGLPRRSGFAIGDYVRDEKNRPIRVSVRESLRGSTN